MKLIGEMNKIDYALLPIGDNFTMGYEDAIIASDFIKCNKVLGYHYDTFGLIEINETNAIDKFKERGKNLILLKPLESLEV